MSRPLVQVDEASAVVDANIEAIERERRLPDAVVAALRASGLNRAVIPAALGGTESPVSDVVDAVSRVAAIDGSAGWCAAIGAGSNVFAGYMPETGAKKVFADADQGSATMFAPTGTVEDGILRGRWSLTSNCLHSAWAGLGAIAHTADGTPEPAPRVVFVPLNDLTVEDTWQTPGLRGTGSNHVRADDVAVELDRSCHFRDRPWPNGTLWRLPIFTVLIPVLAAVPLGIGRGALDRVLATVREAASLAGASSTRTPSAWPSWPPPTPSCGRPTATCVDSSTTPTTSPRPANRSTRRARLASCSLPCTGATSRWPPRRRPTPSPAPPPCSTPVRSCVRCSTSRPLASTPCSARPIGRRSSPRPPGGRSSTRPT